MKFRKLVNPQEESKEVVNEVLLERPPEIPYNWRELSQEQQDNIYKKYDVWRGQFGKIVNHLANLSGYWFVGSSRDDLTKKLRNMSPEKYLLLRNEVASLLRLAKEAQKIGSQVKDLSNKIIEKIDKESSEKKEDEGSKKLSLGRHKNR